MKNIIIFSHPNLQKSKAGTFLSDIEKKLNITSRHLESIYGDNINSFDIKKEQELLEQADRILFKFPLYWLSCPPMLKAYIDAVFTHGWAYGSKANALAHKEFGLIVSTGSGIDVYSKQGSLKHTIDEFLLPFTATANYCQMIIGRNFVFDGVLSADKEKFENIAKKYENFLNKNFEDMD